jgi:excisionase family DNA binding protein
VDDSQPTEFRLLRPCDVVDILGVSRSWLYAAANAGRIPCVRLGGDDGPVRFRADELEAWLEASRVVPTSALSSATARVDRKQSVVRSPARSRRGRVSASSASGQQLGLLPPAADS